MPCKFVKRFVFVDIRCQAKDYQTTILNPKEARRRTLRGTQGSLREEEVGGMSWVNGGVWDEGWEYEGSGWSSCGPNRAGE